VDMAERTRDRYRYTYHCHARGSDSARHLLYNVFQRDTNGFVDGHRRVRGSMLNLAIERQAGASWFQREDTVYAHGV